MKKSILLASLLAAIALTACGKKEEMPVAPTEPAAAPAPAAAEPAAASSDAAATPTMAGAMEAAKEGAAATMDAAKDGAAPLAAMSFTDAFTMLDFSLSRGRKPPCCISLKLSSNARSKSFSSCSVCAVVNTKTRPSQI